MKSFRIFHKVDYSSIVSISTFTSPILYCPPIRVVYKVNNRERVGHFETGNYYKVLKVLNHLATIGQLSKVDLESFFKAYKLHLDDENGEIRFQTFDKRKIRKISNERNN